jgi:NADH:ubiquinone oxidoreductase subunit 6 (subunit J)
MNPDMPIWEVILAGAIAILVVMLFMPRIRESMKRADKQQQRDWRGALIPLLLVALFVILLISLV